MSQKLSDDLARNLTPPAKGNVVTWDSEIPGFGVRITANGAVAFVLNYRVRSSGIERRHTIGRFPSWRTKAARDRAKELRREIDNGGDPAGDVADERAAPTVNELADRFVEEHVRQNLRPSSQVAYEDLITRYIKPALGALKVADVRFADIQKLHRRITENGAPYPANLTVRVANKMFAVAIRWEYRADNPCKGVTLNQESKRTRYLAEDEMARLLKVLATHQNLRAVRIVRLLLFTGARLNEVLTMKWADIDLGAGIWSKPAATTKQKRDHAPPLSAPALTLLTEIADEQARSGRKGDYVFPSRGVAGYAGMHDAWCDIRRAADLKGLRLHDLRHSYASALASGGVPLATIAALLGHSSITMTDRYAHIYRDAQRAATERVGALIEAAGKRSTSPVPIKGRRRGW